MGRCQTHTKANLNKLPLFPNRENLIAVTDSGRNQQMLKPESKHLLRIRIFTLSQSTTAPPPWQNTQGQNLQWTNPWRCCPNQVIKVNVTTNATKQHDGPHHMTHCQEYNTSGAFLPKMHTPHLIIRKQEANSY